MTLSLIVAVAANGVIGRDNQLPWRIPEDLRHFRQVTWGKPLVMGRRTFESLGRPLPGRPHVVVTGNPGWTADGVTVAATVDQALSAASAMAADGEVMVIGGAALFAATLPIADRLYLTEVHRAYAGDIVFPDHDPDRWREVSRRLLPGDPDCSFVVLEARRHAFERSNG